MRRARVYDEVGSEDGTRVLVDRLWPRGIRKDDPRVGHWLKEIAPSNELRKWYGHDSSKYEEFAKKYRQELSDGAQADALEELRSLAKEGTITLVSATKDLDLSQIAVIEKALAKK